MAKKGFEGFEPVFGEAKAEWEQETSSSALLLPFLFYVHALDSARLEVAATDFHSHTLERVLTVHELEDLRDDTGIGGTWSEFVDYLISSLSSGDVKLVLAKQSNVDSGAGAAHAKLITLKSKGLPRVSFSLSRPLNSSVNDTVAKLSLALFKAFRNKHNDVVKEQERSSQLMRILSSEREKNDGLQKQLDALSFLRRKAPKSKSSDKASSASDTLNNSDSMLVSEMQQVAEVPSAKYPQFMKTSQRVAPVSRRAKVRGVSLQDNGDSDDNQA